MNFLNPDGTLPTSDQNWRVLFDNITSGIWSPLPASSFPTGATATTTYAYWTKAVTTSIYFNVQLTGVTAWNTNQYINLPKQLSYITGTIQMITAVPLINNTTGASLGNLILQRGTNTAQLINLGGNISGLQVSGSGSNADFGVTMNPQTGMYQTTVGNTPLPIFTQSQWQGIDQGYGTTNQGITQGGSFIPTWKADPNYMAPNRMSSTGTDIPYNVSLAKADPGMLKAPSFAGGTYEYQRPGTADTTTASYSLDPKTGYYVPSNIQSQNGGDSWWQRNGIQTVDQVILAIGGGLAAAGSLGADAAGGAAGAGATGGSDAISNGTSLFAGDTLPGATTDLGTITSTASTLPADGITAGQVAGGVAGAGGVGGALSNTGSTGTPNMSTNSIPGNNFLPQNDPNLGLGQFNNQCCVW